MQDDSNTHIKHVERGHGHQDTTLWYKEHMHALIKKDIYAHYFSIIFIRHERLKMTQGKLLSLPNQNNNIIFNLIFNLTWKTLKRDEKVKLRAWVIKHHILVRTLFSYDKNDKILKQIDMNPYICKNNICFY